MARPIRYCSVDDCDRRCFGHGWCQKHYLRWRRHGDPCGGTDYGSFEHHQARAASYRRWLQTEDGVAFRSRMSKRNKGSGHPQWKGDSVTYAAGHYRVRAARGVPTVCVTCGEKAAYLEWANLSGRYHDPMDYQSMCKPCHELFDQKKRDPVSGRFLSKMVTA